MSTRYLPQRHGLKVSSVVPPTHARRMRPAQRVLFWTYCFSFAFDFKGKEGGSAIQYVFLAVLILSAALYIASSLTRRAKNANKKLTRVTYFWWIYLFSCIFTAFLMQVEADRFLKLFTPFFVAGVSILLVSHIAKDNISLSEVITPLLYASFASVIWTAYYALQQPDVRVDEMRYQILSPAIPFLLAVGGWTLSTLRRPKLIEVISFGAACGAVFISITRAYILIAGLILLSSFVVAISTGKSKFAKLALASAIIAATAAATIGAVEIYRPDVLDVWASRLFENRTDADEDITTLTREAEYAGQWNELNSSLVSLLVGKGLGSTYSWDKSILDRIGNAGANEATTNWAAAHSFWVYSLYSGGFLFGLIVPVMFLLSWLSSYRQAKFAANKLAVRVDGMRQSEKLLPFIVMSGYIGTTFTANPLLSRFSALLLGIFIALSWIDVHDRKLAVRRSIATYRSRVTTEG